ncbi:MAG TPA: adenylate/guanylate cyclase domain-containing protein, partial [Spirochaetia bacterium]|nr:adenylate/guanylate cyclase domain-containing protein [Spirochaetia bacterium]
MSASERGAAPVRRKALVVVDAVRGFFLPPRGALRVGPYSVVALIGIALGLLVGLTGIMQRLEWAGYDADMRVLAASAHPPGDIVIVAIDELSFEEIGLQWPWPRDLHAELIRALNRAGARTIVFDVLFDRPSGDPYSDEDLVSAVQDAGNVIFAADITDIQDSGYTVRQWSMPFPALRDAAAAIGHAKFPIDPDGTVRRAVLSIDTVPSLALAAAERSSGIANSQQHEASTEAKLIHFSGPARTGIRTVSYYQALAPEELLAPEALRNKTVFVGISLAAAVASGTAASSADHFKTPLDLQMPGVQINADVYDSILRDRFIRDPIHSLLATLSFATAASALFLLVVYRRRVAGGFLAFIGLALVVTLAGYGSMSLARFRLPVVTPLLASFGPLLTTSAYRFTLQAIERRMILGAFKHYLAPALVDRMLSDPSQLRLGGAEYEVTVIFTDLAGFTTISEKLDPESLQRLLTRFFKEMMDILLSENATLDKFIGDAIMVYFGCPVAFPDHAARAARAAVRMQARMRELNLEWAAAGYPEIRMRVGINTGAVVAGNMGTDEIFNFTILGDNVNLASRLEGVNKEYGTLTIASESTRVMLGGDFLLRELDWIRVKGKAEPVAIYEVCGLADEVDDRTRELQYSFAAGLAAYRDAHFEEAEELFTEALV